MLEKEREKNEPKEKSKMEEKNTKPTLKTHACNRMQQIKSSKKLNHVA